MKCGICGRALSNPDSVRRGIGPVCARNIRTGDIKDGQRIRIDKLRMEMARKYQRHLKRYPELKEGEVRCKNCGIPVHYSNEDGCPGPYCCSPCCQYATTSPCPREQKMGSMVDKPTIIHTQMTLKPEG
jgi:hypothetical protein